MKGPVPIVSQLILCEERVNEMNERTYVPGPYDTFRGVVEIDCYDCLSPEQKAKFRIGKFVPVGEVGGDVPPQSEPPAVGSDDPPTKS